MPQAARIDSEDLCELVDCGDLKDHSRLKIEGKQETVAVAHDPPQVGIAEIAARQHIEPVAGHDSMEPVVGPGRNLDR